MPENGERNNASRDETLRRLREALNEDVGRADTDAFGGQLDAMETGYGRDRDRPHRQQVGLDEYGRVKELNSEFLDSRLESYLTQTLDTERANQERKYRRGLLGRAQRWLNETTFGKVSKTVGKATLGGLCYAGAVASAGLAAPLLLGLGTQFAVDAAAEAVQYFGFEQRHVCALRQGRADRVQRVLRAMEIRNTLHNEADSMTHVADPAIAVGATGDLRTELGNIITELNNIDQNVINEERQLAQVRAWGNGIRSVLKLGSAAGGIAYGMAHGGIALGHLVVNGPGHDVFLGGKHFLSFARTAGEITAAHAAGNSLPWALGAVGGANSAMYAAGLGTVTALGINAGISVNESLRNRGFVRNPKGTGVFSLRGRTELGNAENEISQSAIPAETEAAPVDRKTKIAENKNELETVGAVWKWKREGRDEFFISKGFTSEGVLKFSTIDPATGAETGNFTYPANAVDNPYFTAKKLAANVDAFKESLKVDEGVKKISEERGIPVPKENDTLKPGNEFTLNINGTPFDIKLDNDIIVHQIRNKGTEAYVQIMQSNGNEVPGAKGWANMSELLQNVKVATKKEKKSGKESYKETLDSIKKIFEDKDQRAEFKTGIAVRVGTDWYLVGEVNEGRGYIETYKVAGAGAVMPNKAAFAGGEHRNTNIEDFETLIKNKDAGDLELVQGPAGGGGGGGRPRP